MSTPEPHGRWRFLAPAVVCYVIDVASTLVGQPAAYWAGDRTALIEFNPVAARLLVAGPAVFAFSAATWAAIFSAVVMFWRHPLGGWTAVTLTFGHAVGGASWLTRVGPMGWALAVLYLAAAAWLAGRCWRPPRRVSRGLR